MEYDSAARGRSYVGRAVTLDGKPAVICGRQGPFGGVAIIPNGVTVVWSWPAIARIVEDKGGRFES